MSVYVGGAGFIQALLAVAIFGIIIDFSGGLGEEWWGPR